MVTAEDGRRRLRVFAFALALGFGGIGIASWWSERPRLRENSKVVAEDAPRMKITDIPQSYRATFRSENHAGGDDNVSIEKVWVQRPFGSRVETYTNEDAKGEPSSVRQSNFGVLFSQSSGAEKPLNIAVTPSVASGDLRPDGVLDHALRRETIELREVREVYGRRCQVYRAGDSILAGDVQPYDSKSDDYADICIDEHGIVIEEYWEVDGELLRRRAATELDIDVAIPDGLMDVEEPQDKSPARGAVVRIEKPPSDIGLPLWTLAKPPKGFKQLGRYGTLLSASSVPNLGGGEPPAVGPSSTTDVYTRGADIVVIDQDPSLATLASFDGRPTRKVDLDKLKDGKLLIDARMSEVRGATGDGSLVRIFGTVQPDELLRIANKLRPGLGPGLLSE